MKVTVVGAGNVWASCAEYIAIKSIASEVGNPKKTRTIMKHVVL